MIRAGDQPRAGALPLGRFALHGSPPHRKRFLLFVQGTQAFGRFHLQAFHCLEAAVQVVGTGIDRRLGSGALSLAGNKNPDLAGGHGLARLEGVSLLLEKLQAVR